MRSLEQCRAEIFARSEKRIARRRKIRRRVIAGLAPLCLCIVLLTILPMISGPDKSAPMENAECAGEPEYGVSHSDRQQATVVRKDGERWNLSEDQTEQLTCLLDAYLTDGMPAENQKAADYKIEIATRKGNLVCYHLSSSQLTCSGLTAELTESEWLQIWELLQPASE